MYIWLSFSWSTFSGTGNMHAKEYSVGPCAGVDWTVGKLNKIYEKEKKIHKKEKNQRKKIKKERHKTYHQKGF